MCSGPLHKDIRQIPIGYRSTCVLCGRAKQKRIRSSVLPNVDAAAPKSVSIKPLYTHTHTRVHGQRSRAVSAAREHGRHFLIPVFTGHEREHGPWTRVVFTEL